MKQTYEQRVQAIAEEMAIKHYKKSYELYLKYSSGSYAKSWAASFYVDNWLKVLVPSYLECARIAVKHMAAQYECGHHDGWMSKAMNINRIDSPSLQEGLIKSGLIPDDGQAFDPEKEAKTISVSSQMFNDDQEGSKQ